VQADAERLISAGAEPEGEQDYTASETGDIFAMLRDPWGMPVQLVRRGRPLL